MFTSCTYFALVQILYMIVGYNMLFQVNWTHMYYIQLTEVLLWCHPAIRKSCRRKPTHERSLFSEYFVKDVQKTEVKIILTVLITCCLLMKEKKKKFPSFWKLDPSIAQRWLWFCLTLFLKTEIASYSAQNMWKVLGNTLSESAPSVVEIDHDTLKCI